MDSFSDNNDSIVIRIKNSTVSLMVQYGWNGILSVFLFNPMGLLDPVWCKNNTWMDSNPSAFCIILGTLCKELHKNHERKGEREN